jgi:hypothetical protein
MKYIVDFNVLGGPVFSGRKKGETARSKLRLSCFDLEDDELEVVIPEDFLTMTSSFLLGLFDGTIQASGSKARFYDSCKFKWPRNTVSRKIAEESIDEAIQEALFEKTFLK